MPTETIHVPISKLRQDLKEAKDHFSRVVAYHTAVALQQAEQALERFFANERSFFVVIRNDGVLRNNPNHIPPTHFRVIDGGKKEAVLFR